MLLHGRKVSCIRLWLPFVVWVCGSYSTLETIIRKGLVTERLVLVLVSLSSRSACVCVFYYVARWCRRFDFTLHTHSLSSYLTHSPNLLVSYWSIFFILDQHGKSRISYIVFIRSLGLVYQMVFSHICLDRIRTLDEVAWYVSAQIANHEANVTQNISRYFSLSKLLIFLLSLCV